MKLCGTIIKNNKIIKDKITNLNIETNYEKALKLGISNLCNEFDIEEPYWLSVNISEYNKRNKTAFTKDNFIDFIDFDKFIIEILEDN